MISQFISTVKDFVSTMTTNISTPPFKNEDILDQTKQQLTFYHERVDCLHAELKKKSEELEKVSSRTSTIEKMCKNYETEIQVLKQEVISVRTRVISEVHQRFTESLGLSRNPSPLAASAAAEGTIMEEAEEEKEEEKKTSPASSNIMLLSEEATKLAAGLPMMDDKGDGEKGGEEEDDDDEEEGEEKKTETEKFVFDTNEPVHSCCVEGCPNFLAYCFRDPDLCCGCTAVDLDQVSNEKLVSRRRKYVVFQSKRLNGELGPKYMSALDSVTINGIKFYMETLMNVCFDDAEQMIKNDAFTLDAAAEFFSVNNHKDRGMLVLDKNNQFGIIGKSLKDGMVHFRRVPEIREIMTPFDTEWTPRKLSELTSTLEFTKRRLPHGYVVDSMMMYRYIPTLNLFAGKCTNNSTYQKDMASAIVELKNCRDPVDFVKWFSRGPLFRAMRYKSGAYTEPFSNESFSTALQSYIIKRIAFWPGNKLFSITAPMQMVDGKVSFPKLLDGNSSDSSVGSSSSSSSSKEALAPLPLKRSLEMEMNQESKDSRGDIKRRL